MKQKIEIEVSIPDGWKFVRFDTPKEGEQYLNANTHEIRTTKSGREDRGNRIIIKPVELVTEIPTTPFWVELNKCNYRLEINNNGDFLMYSEDGYLLTDLIKSNKNSVSKLLKEGLWKIISEPKKETRPYTEEEWREWFFEDRIVIDNRLDEDDNYDNTIYLSVEGMSPDDDDQFYYMGDGEWYSKKLFLSNFLDRNGNKFEKEVTK